MASVKTAISIDETLFRQAEAIAGAMQVSRSELYALALRDFLHRFETRKLMESLEEAYADPLDEEEQATLRQMWRLQQEVADKW
jgi:metal-responsive CopG/Arc/MetJ family transcriptional regulator